MSKDDAQLTAHHADRTSTWIASVYSQWPGTDQQVCWVPNPSRCGIRRSTRHAPSEALGTLR